MKSESARAAAPHAAPHAATETLLSPSELPPSETRAWLSALVDGDASAVQPACAAWRDDADARQQWHVYQLIGDVMRSEELASRPARDAAFLVGLRTRLALEPVVLAPTELVQTPAALRRRPAWLMPAAAAAGVMVVAGVLVVARVGLPGGAGDAGTLASGQGLQAPGVQAVSDVQRRAAPVLGQGLIRDAHLDEYLRAHQSARGGVAVASPNGALRRVDQTLTGGADR